jgi:predicted transcriptional regulator
MFTEKKIKQWLYESKIRSIIERENEVTYSDLLNKCEIGRTKFNNVLMKMLRDDIVEQTKMSDFRYTYYKITEKGLKCISEDVIITNSLNNIENHRSSK